MDRIAEIAKAIASAVAAAVVAALAGIDWGAVFASAAASGGLTWVVPNRKRRR